MWGGKLSWGSMDVKNAVIASRHTQKTMAALRNLAKVFSREKQNASGQAKMKV
jgi:hypothetical protein